MCQIRQGLYDYDKESIKFGTFSKYEKSIWKQVWFWNVLKVFIEKSSFQSVFYNFLLWSRKPKGMSWWHNHIWQFRFVCILFPYSAKKKQVKAISQILAFSLSKCQCNWQIKENNFEGCNSWLLCVQASSKFLKDEWSKLQLLQSICVIRKVHPKS